MSNLPHGYSFNCIEVDQVHLDQGKNQTHQIAGVWIAHGEISSLLEVPDSDYTGPGLHTRIYTKSGKVYLVESNLTDVLCEIEITDKQGASNG